MHLQTYQTVPPQDLVEPNMRQHVVSIKSVRATWPREHMRAIIEARLRYNAGTHRLFQRTTENFNILFSIKRKKAVAPTNYFTAAELLMPFERLQ